ncbi:DM9 repeat-containing protein [Nodosilinea sp. P-1105]|uniref:DM9 repeat-containing protein n=1 Tax=Nodosilinea sp. P-1105 TaxID=2546229 RepID=UPI00146CE53B|nr:DM9 repeat-containing protein [Nodosilinea sp. P-1105]NMF84673.1 hypothetical protein [Nodosilinea sp. P-1105]
MSEDTSNKGSNDLLNLLLAGGGFIGIAAFITALSGFLPTINSILNDSRNHKPPEAVITVDQPQSSSSNNIYEIVAGTPLKLNPYRSTDGEGLGNLRYSWLIDGKQKSEDEIFSAILPQRSEVYTIALRVKNRRGAQDTKSISVQVLRPVLSDTSTPIPIQSEEATIDSQESHQSNFKIHDYFEWIRISDGIVPDEAFVAGLEYSRETNSNNPLHLCRGEYAGRKIPGKVISGKCNIPLYGIENGDIVNRQERILSRYEVLVPQSSLAWIDHESVPTDSNGLPLNAVFADARDKTLICRTFYEQSGNSGYHPGIVDQEMELCIFPWGGVAGYLRDYEVLVVNQ